MPPIQEIAVPQEQDADNFSVDLLAKTQQASSPNKSISSGSHVSGTQIPPKDKDDYAFLRKDDSSLSNAGSGTSSPQKSTQDKSPAKSTDGAQDTSPAKSADTFDDPYSDLHTEAAARYPFNTRMKHFLRGRPIRAEVRDSVEYCYLAEAGRIVTEDNVMNDKEKADAIVEQYRKLISETETEMFISEELRADMMNRMKGGQRDGFKSRTLWNKWQSVAQESRKLFAHMHL
jgi:hypothetical protein